MNKHTKLFAVLLAAIFVIACSRAKHITISDSDMEAQGFVKAMVITMELDGCTYMLEQESDKKRLEPDGLQPDFQKDSLKVWIKFKPEDRMSVCMAGETISLIEIKKR
ncbi:MAG TPA: hypothetical protein VK826_18350 [Bacteroidia bacterium]|nr:hypothetical protein [Bacteroidia bacterium]